MTSTEPPFAVSHSATTGPTGSEQLAPRAAASGRPSPAPIAHEHTPHPYAPVIHVPQPMPQPVPVMVVGQTKSVGISLVLTFLFGAFGMLYSTVPGALIMLGASLAYGILTGVLSVITLGAVAVVMVPAAVLFWPVQMTWGAIAASRHNARLHAQAAAHAHAAHAHAAHGPRY